ncbi:MAG: MgtC/SapB family protein [Ramlibacter sp.]
MFAPEALLSGSSAAVALAGALGCGLLIGIERERRKGSGPGRALAGVRSFALASVSGAACMVLGGQWLTLVGAAFIAGLGVVAYARDRSGDPGVTTEIALLLTYVIGALCTADLALAAALAVAVTIVLAARERIHRFASQWLRATEVRDGLLLFALALIAVPLLPDRPLWGPVLNPRTIATLLVLLLAIQAMAHLAQRLLQARHALMWSSLAAGFVSSTATIATLGAQVRERRSSPWVMAGAALLSCVPTLVQLLAVAAAVQPAWLEVLWLPALAGGVTVAAWGAWQVQRGLAEGSAPGDTPVDEARVDDAPMFSLRVTAVVAALITGMQVLVHAMTLGFGEAGLLAGSLLAALADLHAAAAAVMVRQVPGPSGAAALILAIGVHALSKLVTGWISGGRRYALALAPGLLGHTVLTTGLLAWHSGVWP